MVESGADLRARVAADLTDWLRSDVSLHLGGSRSTVMQPANYRHGRITDPRRRLWRDIIERYLARQPTVTREGRAALLTAGVPGAGKSHAVAQLGLVDDGWRRLDADAVKDYLLDELAASGTVDDLLAHQLPDGHPVMPGELATLVHQESVVLVEQLRARCTALGENVVIEGTLSWPPAAQQLLAELVRRDYQEVVIVDVEVPRAVAHDQALSRWWRGRQDRIAGHGLGGRFVPPDTIDHAFPNAATGRSVCATNVQAAFDSAPAFALPIIQLRVLDSTGATPIIETHERRSGVLQPQPGPQQLSVDTDAP